MLFAKLSESLLRPFDRLVERGERCRPQKCDVDVKCDVGDLEGAKIVEQEGRRVPSVVRQGLQVAPQIGSFRVINLDGYAEVVKS